MATTDLTPLMERQFMRHLYTADRSQQTYFDKYWKVEDMSQRFYDVQLWEGYQMPEQRDPLEPVKQGQFLPSFQKRYYPISYGLGDVIADEDVRDDLYGIIHRMIPAKSGYMASMFHTQIEYNTSNWLAGNGFASGGPIQGMVDSFPLFYTAHPVSASQPNVTYGNRPSVDADLSVTTYTAAWTSMAQTPDPNGVTLVEYKPSILVVNPNLYYIAKQLFSNPNEFGTANRNINVWKDDVRVLINPYFRVSGGGESWNGWILLAEDHPLRFINRDQLEMHSDFDVNTKSHVFTAFIRYAIGADDWRGCYGSI